MQGCTLYSVKYIVKCSVAQGCIVSSAVLRRGVQCEVHCCVGVYSVKCSVVQGCTVYSVKLSAEPHTRTILGQTVNIHRPIANHLFYMFIQVQASAPGSCPGSRLFLLLLQTTDPFCFSRMLLHFLLRLILCYCSRLRLQSTFIFGF